MIKFDKNEFLKPQIYSTLDEYETRCNVTEEIIKEIEQLQQENKQLQEELECTIGIVEHNRIISEKNKEINQLKDNWNKLKKYINEANEDLYWTNNYDDILYVMQKIEGSDSNENNNI